jgi:divalent metal cation (Fe/Co/Zn/Cd) transporter
VNWIGTAQEQIANLTGISAPPEFLNQLTYMALNHDKNVTAVDTVRAYHFGNQLLVEVDIVLPKGMPLKQTHDIGESLQIKLESLDEVERAFVHLDWEFEHAPEHKKV